MLQHAFLCCRVFVPPQGEPFELVDAELEVSLLGGQAGGPPLQASARVCWR